MLPFVCLRKGLDLQSFHLIRCVLPRNLREVAEQSKPLLSIEIIPPLQALSGAGLVSVSALGQTAGYNLNVPGALYPLAQAQTAHFTGLCGLPHAQILSPTRNALRLVFAPPLLWGAMIGATTVSDIAGEPPR